MRIASITNNDAVNSLTGFTLSIFTQGCSHRCENCFSPQTWKAKGGTEYTLLELKKIITNSKCKNVSILGGDPFFSLNRNEVLELIKWIKSNTTKTLYVWTGYLKEEVEEWIDVNIIDYLIEGKYIDSLYDPKLLLRGSSNQRIFFKGVEYSDEILLDKIKYS